MGVEAVILFDPKKAWEFELRRKRGAHLFSKHRYLAAQMAGYLEGGLWRDLAARSNAAAARLAAGLVKAGLTPLYPVDANMIFFRAPRSVHARLLSQGATYYTMEADAMTGDPEQILTGRLVTDWSRDDAGVDAFLALLT
jgi:threonine aldolase